MFATAAATISRRAMSTTAAGKKVAVLGASGGIGQPLSLLLKLSPEVGELACYDVVGTPGVAADLSHVSAVRITKPKRRVFSRAECRWKGLSLPCNSCFLPIGFLPPVSCAQRTSSLPLIIVPTNWWFFYRSLDD
jgi:hypothetical protein